jgi:hypothetical protein
MILEAYDKFEYKYVKLATSPQRSVDILNSEGSEGWELIKLFEPLRGGDIFKGLLKRRITTTKV